MLKSEKKYTKNKYVQFTPGELRRFLEEKLHVQLRAFSHGDLDRIMEIEGHSFNVKAYPKDRFEEIYRVHAERFHDENEYLGSHAA
jgi:hypothetical protein